MKEYLKGAVTRIASVAVGAAMLVAFASPAAAQSTSIDALLAQIAVLQAQLVAMQGSSSTSMSCNFTTNLSMGMSNSQVMDLQKFLNANGAILASSGAGSPGNETNYFGSITKAAVIRWQNMNSAAVLTPVGLNSGSGYWGPSSRAHANSLCSTTVVVPPVTTVGGSATVTAGMQPAASLAPEGAARIPFTRFTVTAGSSAVTLNSVDVERTGLADDAVFAGVVLLDANGQQLGIARTLGSTHRATIGEPVTIAAGTSMTFTVAGNMLTGSTALDAYAGQVASLAVVGVNTSGTVSGSFPITGASHTIHSTLTIGSMTVNTSGLVNAAATIDIGEKDIIASGIRVTAGSAEDIRLWSIRWNQAGSAAPSDLTNVSVKVNGASYPAVVSADGKYYTSTFGSGIVVAKGNTAEITIQAEVVGGPARTIAFDIYKTTDLYATGENFGYGITPPAGSATAAATTQEFTAGTPWYSSITKTINAGNITTISKSSAVPAQNIAENISDVVLGGYEIDVKGEGISVASSIFRFLITGTGGQVDDIDNITLTNLTTGQLVAGPRDAATAAAYGTVTFTETITYPTGKNTYVLKGKLTTDFSADQTIVASTTPSADWSSITGQITGNTITLTNGLVTMNTMTVKVATATVSVSTQPSAQNVVVGSTNFNFMKLAIDATASGEDVRVNSIEMGNETPTGTSVPTNCFAYSSTGTRLNSTAVNPADATEGTFTFNTALIVTKGTIDTVSINCDIPSSLTNNDSFRFEFGTDNAVSGTGAVSGQSVTFARNVADGQLMTFKTAGTLLVTKDSSSPSYMIVSAGQSNVSAGILKFTTTNESITLKKVALQLTNTASSTNATVIGVSLWNGATKVGSGLFTGTATTTQITLDQTLVLPADADTKVTIKVDLAGIGTSLSGIQGSLVAVDYAGNDSVSTEGVGSSSGTTITSSGSTSDTAMDGIRVFRSYPSFTRLTLASNTTSNTTDKPIMQFKVTATGGDVGIGKFTINVATTAMNVSNSSINVHCYTSYNSSDKTMSSPCSGLSADGQMDDTDKTQGSDDAEIYAENSSGTKNPLQIPAGETRYFEVRGTLTAAADAGDTLTTTLTGDAAYPALATLMGTETVIDSDTNDDFIWSPNATTTSGVSHVDWTNGYLVSGLTSTGLVETLSR